MTNSVWGSFGANFPTREVFATETFTTLRALTNPKTGSNVTINVDGGVTKGDGLGGIFYYDSSSVLADDSVNVIAPTTSVGRWIRRDIVPGYNNFRKNIVINGGMEISQRGVNFVAPNDVIYILDRWRYRKNGAMVHTVSQDGDVPTVAQAGQLFINSLRYNLTTPDDSITAAKYCFLEQYIEGYNWRALAQRDCVLSFWVKATLPGIYSACVETSSGDKIFVSEYTILAANTWEKKIINILPSPVGGAWNYTTGVGLKLIFNIASGSNYFASINNSWNAIGAFAAANQINGVQTGATDFRITGIQLEAGSVASEFERRTIQDELILCQRYYEKSWKQGVPILTALGDGFEVFTANGNIPINSYIGQVSFKVLKRANPTIISYPQTTPSNIGRLSDGNGNDLAANSCQVASATDRTVRFVNLSAGVIVPALGAFICHWTADAEL